MTYFGQRQQSGVSRTHLSQLGGDAAVFGGLHQDLSLFRQVVKHCLLLQDFLVDSLYNTDTWINTEHVRAATSMFM